MAAAIIGVDAASIEARAVVLGQYLDQVPQAEDTSGTYTYMNSRKHPILITQHLGARAKDGEPFVDANGKKYVRVKGTIRRIRDRSHSP